MSNVVLTRIDNRLIHGSVATQWAKEIAANVLLVANDAVAQDEFKQQLMNMAAPAGVDTRYLSLADAAAALKSPVEGEHIFVIVESPKDALALAEAGADLNAVNVGNIHMKEGKRQIATTVAVDDADVADLKKLADKGFEVFIQRTPNVEREDASALA
jgi:PTS system N-acetylgalactosamine-specific IIB component